MILAASLVVSFLDPDISKYTLGSFQSLVPAHAQRLTPTTVAIDWLGHGAVNSACAKLDPTSLDFTKSLRFALLTDDSVFILHKFVNVLGGHCNAEGRNQS